MRAKDFSYTSLIHADYESVAGFKIVAENEDIILLYGKNNDFGLMQMHYAFNATGCFLRHTEKYNGFMMTFVNDKVAAKFKQEGFKVFDAQRAFPAADKLNAGSAKLYEKQGFVSDKDEHGTALYKP